MPEPSPLRRKLGAELRRVRSLRGASQSDLGMHQTTVSRIENGISLPKKKQADRWLELADPDDRDLIVTLLNAAHRETRTWDELFDEQTEHLQDEARQRNEDAVVVRNFQQTVVPGLLQTADYASRVLELGHSDVPAAVDARLQRQQVLYEPGRRFEFILTSDVLRCAVAPLARTGQLHQLASLATLKSVELAVFDLDAARGVIPWNAFVWREPADGSPPYVTVELIHGQQTISDPGAVNHYELTWDALWSASARGEDAVAAIRACLEGSTP